MLYCVRNTFFAIYKRLSKRQIWCYAFHEILLICTCEMPRFTVLWSRCGLHFRQLVLTLSCWFQPVSSRVLF